MQKDKKYMNEFDYQYRNILNDIMNNGIEEINQRTGTKVKALPGMTFKLDLEKHGFPLLALRKLPYSFVPEIMWMLSGKRDITWLKKFTPIWNYFAEENDIVTSAYGFRWKYHFEVDQLNEAIKKLENDPSNRQTVIMMWSPKEDLIKKQKNVPCPVMFTLNVIGGKLCLHLIIRSNDMILGNPTDVAGFAFLLHILAQKLNLNIGTLTVSISNAHIYENQYYVAKELLDRFTRLNKIELTLPNNCYDRCVNLDDSLVAEIKNSFNGYDPLPAIKNIPIAI